MLNGQMNGKVRKITKTSKASYEGQMKDNERSGYGVYNIPGRFKYIGEWANDKYDG